ncbi:hypothetical protein [Aldersonia kunmingensis]|uniref:hypothetical protein n=1 Tax=Aldersonia kunmingensis TaxID=408066 RepID=UPI0012ECEED5|nr:hypothetical protein [Aldersonia kunmingensis]
MRITYCTGETLVLAPLESRTLSGTPQQWPWDELLRRGIVEDGHGDGEPGFDDTDGSPRGIFHGLAILLVVAISIAVPIVAYFFDQVAQVAIPAVAIAFVAVATMLPALLFFLFDRQRLSTLRDRFQHDIFRLDPNMHTLADVRSRYGHQMDEVYFKPSERTTIGSAGQRLWPIVIATATIALGWTMALAPKPWLFGDPPPQTLFDALGHPQSFAFLGAYFYTLNTCLNRYARNDLRPKGYSAITVRIIISVVLAFLLQAILQSSTINDYNAVILPLAFTVGVLPETAITLLRDVLKKVGLWGRASQLEDKLPLTLLEGLELYDRARLIDEGVPNMEALAHQENIDLLLETRISIGRLVDWVDQSILYLHVVNSTLSKDKEGAQVLEKLRALGIRTATDLFQAVRIDPRPAVLIDAFRRGTDTAAIAADRLTLLLAAMRDDEWMSYLWTWRRRTLVSDRKINLARDGSFEPDFGPNTSDGDLPG